MTAQMENIDQIVRDIVGKRTSRAIGAEELRGEVALGSDGLGLDSIAIAEVLLDCQQHFGVNVTSLLEQEPLTLRRLIEHLERETAA
jgi:acyl carrier protein